MEIPKDLMEKLNWEKEKRNKKEIQQRIRAAKGKGGIKPTWIPPTRDPNGKVTPGYWFMPHYVKL